MTGIRKFVVQKHTRQNRPVHWDWMFQAGNVLQTYRIEQPPAELPTQGISAIRIVDHPLRFLTYQGTVNKGEGNVQIAEKGTYRILSETESTRKLLLDGKTLKGQFSLKHISDDRWLFSSS